MSARIFTFATADLKLTSQTAQYSAWPVLVQILDKPFSDGGRAHFGGTLIMGPSLKCVPWVL